MTLQKPPGAGNPQTRRCIVLNMTVVLSIKSDQFAIKCHHSFADKVSLTSSFAGGTWDWEYLGFASPEVTEQAFIIFSLLDFSGKCKNLLSDDLRASHMDGLSLVEIYFLH